MHPPTTDKDSLALDAIQKVLFTDFDLEWRPSGENAGWTWYDFRPTGMGQDFTFSIAGVPHTIENMPMFAQSKREHALTLQELTKKVEPFKGEAR